MHWPVFRTPLCSLRFLSSYWMRPWIAETKSCGGFLGSEFGGCFNDRAKRIAHLSRILAVGVVNAP
jgi:hypothetical protein